MNHILPEAPKGYDLKRHEDRIRTKTTFEINNLGKNKSKKKKKKKKKERTTVEIHLH